MRMERLELSNIAAIVPETGSEHYCQDQSRGKFTSLSSTDCTGNDALRATSADFGTSGTLAHKSRLVIAAGLEISGGYRGNGACQSKVYQLMDIPSGGYGYHSTGPVRWRFRRSRIQSRFSKAKNFVPINHELNSSGYWTSSKHPPTHVDLGKRSETNGGLVADPDFNILIPSAQSLSRTGTGQLLPERVELSGQGAHHGCQRIIKRASSAAKIGHLTAAEIVGLHRTLRSNTVNQHLQLI